MPENKDGLAWQPADGVLLTLSPEKSLRMQEILIFFPSVYPKIATIKHPGSSEAANIQSVAHDKCAKQRYTNKEIAEQETREKEVVQQKKAERNSVVIQCTRRAFQNDHGSYCSRSNNSTPASVTASPFSLYVQSSWSGEEGAIKSFR